MYLIMVMKTMELINLAYTEPTSSEEKVQSVRPTTTSSSVMMETLYRFMILPNSGWHRSVSTIYGDHTALYT